jgi:hypothetical protein
MKKIVWAVMAGVLLIAANLFAADGDLIVEGNVGIGTTTPTAPLDVNGSIVVKKANWEGIYFGNKAGLIWRLYGGGTPAINSKSLVVGNDDFITEIYWDTIWDGAWAYCEGITGSGNSVNCADYAGIMDSNDFYWVWKHGYPTAADTWCTGDCQTRRRDLKFVFDGESNDGVMGYMEDEDAFFFDQKVGIGTRTPTHPLEMVSGAYVTTGGVWTNASSREYKENISDLSADKALQALKDINPVQFNYKANVDEKHLGFIAEDVPEIVATKDRKGLSPMDIAAVLTRVVQEQQKIIDSQQKAMQEQKKEMEELKVKVQRLETKDFVAKAQ